MESQWETISEDRAPPLIAVLPSFPLMLLVPLTHSVSVGLGHSCLGNSSVCAPLAGA